MSNIVLAIVGTRNLLYNGKVLSENQDIIEGKVDFRGLTEKFLRNWKTYGKLLGINIINLILEKYNDEGTRLILVSSDQKPLQRNNPDYRIDQDTKFAAEILKRLIKDVYANVEIEIWTQKVSVADPNQQMEWFFSQIRRVRDHNIGQVSIVAVDAGGTAQQKTAMKLALEFLMPPKSYQVYGILRQKDFSSKLQLQPPVEYRSVIALEQIRQLVSIDQYDAASTLFEQIKSKEPRKDLVVALLEHGHFRKKRQLGYARKALKKAMIAGLTKSQANLLAFDRQGNYSVQWAKILTEEDFYDLSEQLNITFRSFDLSDWDGFVLGLAQFIELYSLKVVRRNLGYDFLDYSRRKEEVERFLDSIKSSKRLEGSKLYYEALEYVNSSKNIEILKILALLHSSYTHSKISKNSNYIDFLRNKYVHEGIPVTEPRLKRIKDLIPALDKLRELFGLKGIYPYGNLINIINEYL